MSLLLLGFLIGLRHALEADHLAAVAALSSQATSARHAVRMGVVWGTGHTLSLFAVGSVVVVLDTSLPENFAHWLEFGVGVMLVLLGADVIRRIVRDRIHFHVHKHEDGVEHFHGHAHSRLAASTSAKPPEPGHGSHQHAHQRGFPMRALVVGLIHGMAGSAALILLALTSVDSVWQALLYMLLFGLGSILGMAALSLVIALPLRLSARGLTLTHNTVQAALGLGTIAIGVALMHEVGGRL